MSGQPTRIRDLPVVHVDPHSVCRYCQAPPKVPHRIGCPVLAYLPESWLDAKLAEGLK